ncbi:MAG: PAS domain-containing sensor histidine kinase [Alphaproteobacteria bacterium]|nr:PAS domain-containing sensor histidine kinase [Alphaproteobacteria bacterium]
MKADSTKPQRPVKISKAMIAKSGNGKSNNGQSSEADDEAMGLLAATGKQETGERQHRLRIVAISSGILVVIVFGMVVLANMGMAPYKDVPGFLIESAILILAIVIGRNLHKISRFGKIETILGEAFQAAFSPQVIADNDGRAVLTNKAYDYWIGKPGSNVEAVISAKFHENATVAAEFQKLRKAAHANQPSQAELPVIKGGKITEWRRVIVRPLPSTGYIIWRFEDISERKRAEQAVREEQAKLIDFMAHAPVGIYSADQNGRFRFVNRTLAEWLGCSIEELTSGSIKLHDIIARKLDNVVPYGIAAGQDGHLRGDTFMRSKKGKVFPVSITQTVVMNEDGQTLRTRSIVRDLTPEQSWQEALTLSEQRFHRLFAEAPIGVALLTSTMQVEECNQAFTALIKREKNDILKKNFINLIAADRQAAIADELAAVLAGRDLQKPIELRGMGDASAVAFIYAKRFTILGHIVHADEGTPQQTGLMLYFIDYSEQKRIEAQLAHSVKLQAIGQLAGGVAHDFNNLLTAMIGFCDLLLQRHKPGDQSFADIMQIKQNGNRAANLVRQLLAFSRQQTLQPKTLSVTDVLAELANLLRRLIGANVELKMVHARDVGLIRADQGQLEQVIINLVVNARDAMPQGGAVTITTGPHHQDVAITRGQDVMQPGDYIKIAVADQGIGIPKENIQRIFEPFFSTKEVGSGTGLGLSTVYGIVRQTGGFVEVDSVVGKGSTFIIYLPHHIEKEKPADAVAEPVREKKASDLTGAGTILLVEDEDAVRVFGARALRNKGYNVLEARGGEEALKVIDEQGGKIDLLISDVVMPQMDGPTLVREVMRRKPDTKVVFISGYTEDKFREQLREGEVVHFLSKPFSLKQLASKVKEVLTGEVEE